MNIEYAAQEVWRRRLLTLRYTAHLDPSSCFEVEDCYRDAARYRHQEPENQPAVVVVAVVVAMAVACTLPPAAAEGKTAAALLLSP